MIKLIQSYSYNHQTGEITSGEEVLKHPSVLDYIAPQMEGFTILHTMGHFESEQILEDLSKSSLKGLVPFAYKDSKIYLLPEPTILYLFGSKGSVKSYSNCLALNRPVRVCLNPFGTKYKMLVQRINIDGVVAVMKQSKISRVTFAKRVTEGVTIFAKGGMIQESFDLENCPEEIPPEFDGVLNLNEVKVNGYSQKDPECPREFLQFFPEEGSQIELTVGVDLFVAQNVKLNIRKKGLSLHIGHMMNSNAQDRIRSEAIRQLKKLARLKEGAKDAKDIANAIYPYLPPHGPLADLINILEEAGFIPSDLVEYLPYLFDAAAVRILKNGPNFRQVFTTALPGTDLDKYEVLVPQPVWDSLTENNPYTDGRQIELWRNPVRPGLDAQGRSLSCGVFDIVGISSDSAFYINSETWSIMGGDFDLDPIAGYIPEFYHTRDGRKVQEKLLGLGRVSSRSCPVKKIKSAEPPRSISDVSKAVIYRASMSLSAHLGKIYNRCADLIDHAFVKGGDTMHKLMNESGALMAAMIDASVFTQKHEARIYTNGHTFSTNPNENEGYLSFERCEAYLDSVAEQIGRAAKSPTRTMELLRYIKGLQSFVLRSRLQLEMIPKEPLKGIWGEVLTAAKQVGLTKIGQLNVQGETLVPYLLDLLRYEHELYPPKFDESPIPDVEIERLYKRFLEAQNKNPDSRIAILDNEWGFYSLGLAWSRDKNFGLASRASLGARIISLGKLIKLAKSTVEAVKLLSVDYRLLRKLGVDADLDLSEIEDIDPTLFSQRELDEDEGGYDDAGNFIGGIKF